MKMNKLLLFSSFLFYFIIFSEVAMNAATIYAYPPLPGAVSSPLYSIKADGTTIPIEKLTKYSGEMQVHYTNFSLDGTANIQVTINENFNSYTLSPKSRNISTSRSGNTISFSSGPNYLILSVDSKELLFILIDSPENNPPQLGDPDVKNILDYGIDNSGATLVTSEIQSAINTASGASQNILFFPPGKYLVGELWLRSNMSMYLAGGAVLYGSNNTSDFNTGSGGVNIEGMQHSLIRISNCTNTKLLGRGVIDGNGKAIRAKGLNASVLKMDSSSNILVDGIISRDSSYWNTIPYRSDRVTIKNYKVINCRPTSKEYNNTDGVDFDECTNALLYNAFLYCGDDNLAVKNENDSYDGIPTKNTRNIVHEKIVAYSNSAGCKIGTKTKGQSMQDIIFRNIDIVKCGRGLVIDAYDTAVVSNTTFENIRIENTNLLIDLAEDNPPSWRSAANESIIKDTYFTNVSSDVKKVIDLDGRNSTYNIDGVHFNNLTIQGKPITSRTDSDASWSINSFVYNITFNSSAQTPSPLPTPTPTVNPDANICVRARGTLGGENLELHIDGNVVASWTMSTAYQDYYAKGNGIIELHFTNDDQVEDGMDIQVDYLIYNNTTYQAEDQQTNTAVYQDSSCGGSYSEMMHCSGYILFSTTAVATPHPPNTGDVNSDNAINIVDALMVAQYYVGLNPSGFDAAAADVNCDGNINIVDALILAQYYVGLVNSFC